MKRKLTTFVAAGAAAFGGAFLLTGAGGPLAHGSATNLEAYGGCYTYNTFSGSSYCASADADSTGVKVCYGYMDIESDQRTCQNV